MDNPVACYQCSRYQASKKTKDGVPVCSMCAEDLHEPDEKGVDAKKLLKGSDVEMVITDKDGNKKEIKGFTGIDYGKIREDFSNSVINANWNWNWNKPVTLPDIDFDEDDEDLDTDGDWYEAGEPVAQLCSHPLTEIESLALQIAKDIDFAVFRGDTYKQYSYSGLGFYTSYKPYMYFDNFDPYSFAEKNGYKIYPSPKPFNSTDFLQISLHDVAPKVGSDLEALENDHFVYEGYEPAIVSNCWDFWRSTSYGVVNNKTFIFPRCGEQGGEINYFSVSSEEGEVLFVGKITSPVWASKGINFSFNPGTMMIELPKDYK